MIKQKKSAKESEWDSITRMKEEHFMQSATAYHKNTIRMALSLRGHQREYVTRAWLGSYIAESILKMLGMKPDGSRFLDGEMSSNVKWAGLNTPNYTVPPRRDLVISKVIEARRLTYWAHIQSPDHDSRSDKEILKYSKKCRENSRSEFLSQVKRDNEAREPSKRVREQGGDPVKG